MSRASVMVLLQLVSLGSGATFPGEEYVARLHRAQSAMAKQGLSAMVLAMEVHHMYFTGMRSEFGNSTRPSFLVVPAEGLATAVVPGVSEPLYEAAWDKMLGQGYGRIVDIGSINGQRGAYGQSNYSAAKSGIVGLKKTLAMEGQKWNVKACPHSVGAIRSWASPRPEDDGVSELAETLSAMLPAKGRARVGVELGWEASLRMPAGDLKRLETLLGDRAKFEDATLLLKRLRAVKSEAEVGMHRSACKHQSKALDRIPKLVHAGMTEREVCRIARIEAVRCGNDQAPYLSCRSGPGGYDDNVGAATDRQLQAGDMLIIDMGSVLEGQFCDFNRNWFVGDDEMPAELSRVHSALYTAVDAGIAAAKPGATTADLFAAMAAALSAAGSGVGHFGHSNSPAISEWPDEYFGHSVGLEIAEWPWTLPGATGQNVTLEEGMVLAVEPSAPFGDAGQFLVHEELIVVRKGGGELLSRRGPREIPRIPMARAIGSDEDACQLTTRVVTV